MAKKQKARKAKKMLHEGMGMKQGYMMTEKERKGMMSKGTRARRRKKRS